MFNLGSFGGNTRIIHRYSLFLALCVVQTTFCGPDQTSTVQRQPRMVKDDALGFPWSQRVDMLNGTEANEETGPTGLT